MQIAMNMTPKHDVACLAPIAAWDWPTIAGSLHVRGSAVIERVLSLHRATLVHHQDDAVMTASIHFSSTRTDEATA